MIRYFIIVSGRVQGVGFRYFAQSNAIKCSLTGTAKNLTNGMVELEVQGLDENINKFLSTLQKGNTFVKVDDISLKPLDIKITENNFKVIY